MGSTGKAAGSSGSGTFSVSDYDASQTPITVDGVEYTPSIQNPPHLVADGSMDSRRNVTQAVLGLSNNRIRFDSTPSIGLDEAKINGQRFTDIYRQFVGNSTPQSFYDALYNLIQSEKPNDFVATAINSSRFSAINSQLESLGYQRDMSSVTSIVGGWGNNITAHYVKVR